MTTPILILCLLFLPLLAAIAIGGSDKIRIGGVLGMASAFVFFGIGHFVQTEAMIQMLPPFVPLAKPMVLATGGLELAIAVALLFPASRRLAGCAAIAVFIGFFPANVYAALNYTGMGGHQWGPVYLLIRVPLQIFLVFWVWYFALNARGARRGPDFVNG